MRPALKLARLANYLRMPFAAAFATVFFCSFLMAQGEKSMFRYVSEKTGREVYALKNSQRKVMDDKAAKGGWIVQQVGYAYAEQRTGTTALYGLILMEPGGGTARVTFTFSETEYKNLTSKNSPKKWKPYFSDSPIVAYVLTDGGQNRLGAHYFTTKGSGPDDDPRIRFEGGEYEKWKGFPNTEYFPGGPSFWIFKDKPETAKPKDAEPKKQDQNLRQYLYILGKNSIFSKSAKYASVGKQHTLNPKDAKSCDDTGCTFYVGMMISRSIADEFLSTYLNLINETAPKTVSNSTSFKKGEGIATMVLPLRLNFGVNSVKVQLKPYLPKDDFNPLNNTATFTIMLNK